MKIGPFHLTYCTNVHPGESWDQIFANLKTYLLEVRDRLSPGKRFAAGIWLPERSINTLSEPGRLESFLEFLKSEDLYLSGVNAFPYGNFHAPPVKQSVYLPDWTDRRRLNYSNRVATVLSRILVDTDLQEGNLSTVPGAFKPSITETEQIETMARHFLDHAAHLHEIHQQTGCIVSLAIEPEPYCFLETTDEVIDFFQQHLMTPSGLQYFSDRTGVEKSDAENLILRHVGVCFDVCHLAVQFEDPVESIETLQRSGIQIFRIQLSSAVDIEIKGELQDNLARLSKFNEEVYLHQVVERDLSEPEPALRRFPDLPEALESLKNEGPDLRPRQWRIHFHLPLFLPGPTEPILIGVGGGSLAGIFQALYLRSQGVAAYRWLKLWIVGLLAGMAAAAAVLTLLGWTLGPFIRSALTDQGVYLAGQLVFYLVYGSLLGTLAGLISGGAIVAAVPSGGEPEVTPTTS